MCGVRRLRSMFTGQSKLRNLSGTGKDLCCLHVGLIVGNRIGKTKCVVSALQGYLTTED